MLPSITYIPVLELLTVVIPVLTPWNDVPLLS